jgi:hypothetical protein
MTGNQGGPMSLANDIGIPSRGDGSTRRIALLRKVAVPELDATSPG